ncbi:LOW QUALITY PROTEIN: uncharacterized protein LOC128371134%2C partial [Xyrichtys novacula]|uniref:LOW QUALITY PROTEIN: uncharacterized protein LOC128371134, partial n=1 Tax=Xyrichtys novacula TaxID=13765 RepID=A0AAV1GGJ1_XYRNO|nr:LOW QUALITY PROTEIN: uncharacterized protein LOC128371134%2C partial [Xyrichtys novacula]
MVGSFWSRQKENLNVSTSGLSLRVLLCDWSWTLVKQEVDLDSPGGGSAMNQCEDREEGAPPSKTTLWGEHESQTKVQRPELQYRPDSPGPGPGPSCVSLKSDRSRFEPILFKGEICDEQRVKHERPDSPGSGPGPSCVSLKSDRSMGRLINFKEGEIYDEQRVQQQRSEVPIGQSAQQHQTQLDSIFMLLQENMISFVKEQLKEIQRALSPDEPEYLESPREDEDEEQRRSREAFLKITVNFLRRMKQEELADCLQRKVRHKLKSNLKEKFQCVFEGIAKAGNPTLLNQIYTDLYITEGGTGEVNDEHEVRQIETASRRAERPETTIRQEDIFKGSPGRQEPIRTVMTKGVAGIGKTVLTQKWTLDWAEDKDNQDIHFTFPFTFRELNVLKEKKFSLVGLVHHFFTQTKEAGICSFQDFRVVFIFDGLDECRLPLDFHNNQVLTDVTESSSVDVLLTNLIRGNLLPSARLWITTRPAAANQIPPECVDMVTEVRGFTDPQKEEYFRKRFRDEKQASRIISHIKTSRSLHIMCHIPVFCWITATVLEDLLKTREGRELPKTLTEMYIHFLVVQSKLKNIKYDGGAETDPHWSPESRKMIESLGKLAFKQLQKGNLIFYESDLTQCGMDIRAASVYSGVFTQIFREERGLYQDKVFCFIHLSVQEFLAALHVHLTFTNSGVNLMEEEQQTTSQNLTNLHVSAVDQALQSLNGHLDLFLRFLLGLSLQTNQNLLRGLLTHTGSSSQTNQETVQYIKKKISEDLSAEKSINLFHCLNELNDRSLVNEIQRSLRSGRLSTEELSPAQWSALVFILLSSEKDLDVFDLKKYSASEEGLLRLLPVVKASNKALLSGCNLSERSCEVLSSVLSSQSSSLRELDLSNNDLQDSGVKLLSAGLKSPHCKLETLRLSGCLITEEGCASLVSALSSNPSHLRDLDLSYNHPGDSGVKLLSAGLKDPLWRLETLRVDHGGEQRLKPGLKKCKCGISLTPDDQTADCQLTKKKAFRKLQCEDELRESGLDVNAGLSLRVLLCDWSWTLVKQEVDLDSPGGGSAMNQCEDREEGAPPSKTTLWGEHESQTKVQSSTDQTVLDLDLDPAVCPLRVTGLWVDILISKMDIESNMRDQTLLDPGPSCVSFKSDWSTGRLINFKEGEIYDEQRVQQQRSEVPIGQSAQQHQTQLDSIFMLLQENMISFVKEQLKEIQRVLSPDEPEYLESPREDEDEEQRRSREAFLKITVNFLRRMKQEELADCLLRRSAAAEVRHKLKSNLKEKFQCVFEGIAKAGNPTLLNQIYTDLYITEGGTGEVNHEHEVRQIETASRRAERPETTIRQEDIFKGSPGRQEPIRTVMTKGVAGIGKTVLTQKWTLDWAEDKDNQDIHFTFPFTFRELNVLKEKKFSLVGLVHHFFSQTKEAGICSFQDFRVVFIFDGLDECRLPLDFHNNQVLTDVTESSSVDVLLTNLIRGNLLPSARLWITTRPAAANQIPPECVDMVTEVRGFTDPQKEEYFRKRFRDEKQASRIISHIKTSRSLHIMCHIPVFCWITATVLEDLLKTREGGELPKTLTEMYIHFLVVQSKLKNIKYDGGAETDPHWSPESRKMIKSLGKLAFEQLQRGHLIFYESDLTQCGMDIRAASVYSGVFTQIFREERGLYQDKVFCFIHLSVQEFLAALHVHLTFTNSGVNLMEEEQQTTSSISKIFSVKPKLKHLHQSAVDQALQSLNGHLDLFLRFLLGLSLQTNQNLLRGLLTHTGSSSQTNQKTVQYIKKKISEDLSAEKSINLFHCLNELNDRSLVEEIQRSLRSGRLSTEKLSPAQWSALVFILLSSEKDLDVFDLKKYSSSEEALLRLLPVVKASNKALLSGCNLTKRSCEVLSSVLSSQSSSLRDLDLSHNDLQDSGVKLLSAGLKSPHCKLETLRLSGCLITEEGCASLASALSSNPSHLRELDLSYNHPGDSGVKLLSAGLKDPLWRLETLRVDHGGEQRLKPGVKKCKCGISLTPDDQTADCQLTKKKAFREGVTLWMLTHSVLKNTTKPLKPSDEENSHATATGEKCGSANAHHW